MSVDLISESVCVSKKKQYEKDIAEAFLLRRGGGWTIDAVGENPDIVIANGNAVAGLELARYRQQGPHNEAHQRIWELRTFIHEECRKDDSVNRFSVFPDFKKDSEGRFAIPSRQSWPALVQELKALVGAAADLAVHECVGIAFLKNMGPDADLVAQAKQHRALPAQDYPLLSKHFDEVIVTKHDVIVGKPGTSASFHNVYLDAEEVRRTVRKHAEKLPEYRAKLPDGAPVWLLVHSDGWPLSAHIGIDRLMQEAVEVARQVLVQSKHKFDEAWWLDDAVISQDGKLVRLV